MATELHRAVRALHEAGRDYPSAWAAYNRFRTQRAEFGDWPEYVFAPLAAAYAVASGGGVLPLERAGDVARLGALSAWRPTQGIYRLAPALLEALWQTPVTGDLPTEILHRLPEWCVYLELGQVAGSHGLHGAWVHLEFDANTHREELRILLDRDHGLLGMPVPLVGTLDDSLKALQRSALTELVAGGLSDLAARSMLHEEGEPGIGYRDLIEPVVSVALYLCTANAELRADGDSARPRRPAPHRHKSGELRWAAADQSTIWEIGTRLGAALARAQRDAESGAPGETGRTRRPHVRRAHWHAYWLGAHDAPDRRRELRWLPPVFVNLEEGEAPALATVRSVPDPAEGES